jgi:Uma2 family endonuclease
VRGELQNCLVRRLEPSYRLFNEPGWRPGGDYNLEPDMVICRAGPQPSAVLPAEVLLKVEVSDSSLAYDTSRKAAIYARLGVPEYWVIDVNRMTTRVHRGPTSEGYSDITTWAADTVISVAGIPGFATRLTDLGIPPL